MLSQDRLKSLLKYNELTGEFIWIAKSSSKSRNDIVGSIAGTINHTIGRRTIKIDQRVYLDYQLAFLYMLGHIPDEIDHKDNMTLNTAWNNLREVTKSENQWNRIINANNTSGVKGVILDKRRNKYQGRVNKHGKRYTTGYHDTLEEAQIAVQNLRNNLHSEFTHHG